MGVIRISYISKGLHKISLDIVETIVEKRATHVTFHSNKICCLDIKSLCTPIDLKHLVDLDLSSNSLHSGCALTDFGLAKHTSLLDCCLNLLQLNIQSNAFTSKSFATFITTLPILPHLTTIDVSYNNISKLPPEFHQKCPSLRNLSAVANRIKSFSSLLNWLHPLRGQLECLVLSNQKELRNPVCSAPLYREKVVYVLGDRLKQLDLKEISDAEREEVRVRLSIYSRSRGSFNGNENVTSSDMKIHKREYDPPLGIPSTSDDGVLNDENKMNASPDVEHRVEFLSNLIEKQAHITRGLLEVTQHRNNNEIVAHMDRNEQDNIVCSANIKEEVDNAVVIRDLRRTAACTLLKLTLIQEKCRLTMLRIALYRWIAAAVFRRQFQTLKLKFTKSENKWKERANLLVANAIKQEQQKSSVAVSESAEKSVAAENMIEQLHKRVNELEICIESERSKSATLRQNSNNETEKLRNELQRAHEDMKRVEEEEKDKNRLVTAEVESIRVKLYHAQEDLQNEKGNNVRLEIMYKELSKATQEVRNESTAHSAELNNLKLELTAKEATIKQLKDAYENAANRAASDRSKCEHAMAGERRKGEMVNDYAKKLRSLESEKEKLVALRTNMECSAAKRETQLASLQQVVHEQSAKISKLNSIIEEKECKIDSQNRRLKYISDERDVFHQQLTENNRIRTQLQSQLDQAKEELRNSKWTSSEAHQLETMKLQQTLDTLRQSSQLREQELSANLKLLQREAQDKSYKQTHLIKSLGSKLKGCEAREVDLEKSHRIEVQKLTHIHAQELKVLEESLAYESESINCSIFVPNSNVEAILTFTLAQNIHTHTHRKHAIGCRKKGSCIRRFTASTRVKDEECYCRPCEGIHNLRSFRVFISKSSVQLMLRLMLRHQQYSHSLPLN